MFSETFDKSSCIDICKNFVQVWPGFFTACNQCFDRHKGSIMLISFTEHFDKNIDMWKATFHSFGG